MGSQIVTDGFEVVVWPTVTSRFSETLFTSTQT